MAVITSQKIATFYEKYNGIDMVFTKEMIEVTGLVTNQVFLKCGGDFWPCVIYSSSFQGAKIIANTKTGILKKVERANNSVSLRFCFKTADSANPLPFFVTTKLNNAVPYKGSTETVLITLQFTQRPPDDLIEIVGRVLDANINSKKRKADRISITPDSVRRLGLESKDCVIFIENVPRHCILRDISFSGAKVIMVGVEKFLVNKNVELRMDFNDPKEAVILKGRFIRAEPVEGRKELVALALNVEENAVPMGYKMRINEYISQVRADARGWGSEETANQSSASQGSAKQSPTNQGSKAAGSVNTEPKKPEPAAQAGVTEGKPAPQKPEEKSAPPKPAEKPIPQKPEETPVSELLDDFELIFPDAAGQKQ